MTEKKHIVVALNRLPHYRRDMIRLLAIRHNIVVTFSRSDDPKNPIASADIAAPHIQLQLLRLGQVRWQRGLTRQVNRRTQFAMFTGDVRYLSTWTALLKARLLRIPTATWGHAWSSEQRAPLRWLRLLFYRLGGETWVYTDSQARRAIMYGIPAASVTVVGNSTNALPMVRTDLPSPFRVGFVGRLVRQRSLDLLLDAAHTLKEGGWNLDIEIIGTGEAEQHLQERAHQLGLSVEFHGPIHDDESVAKIVANWTACIVPSFAGLSIITALSQGCPVIVSDDESENGPEWSAVREGETGWHFKSGSADDLATVLLHVRNDTSLSKVSRSARQTYQRDWTPEVLADRLSARIYASRR